MAPAAKEARASGLFQCSNQILSSKQMRREASSPCLASNGLNTHSRNNAVNGCQWQANSFSKISAYQA
jgi:hypothetical protein